MPNLNYDSVNLVDRENAAKRIVVLTCKIRYRYSRERARQKFAKCCQISKLLSLLLPRRELRLLPPLPGEGLGLPAALEELRLLALLVLALRLGGVWSHAQFM